MLIHVDRSAIEDAAGAGATAPRSRAAIESLLRAHGEGQHLVSIEPEDVLRLAPVAASFSERGVSVLERIEADAADIAGLRTNVAWHLVVGLGPDFVAPSKDAGRRRFHASLHHFERLERAMRPLLLCENLTDAKFYSLLAASYLIATRMGEVHLAYEPRGGGGDQFAAELAQAATSGRLLLAIADSDRGFPGGPPGGTWQHAAPIARTLLPFQSARELPVRAIENLVPLPVYRAAFLANHHNDGRLQVLDRLRALQGWLDHANLKQGIRLFQIEEEMTGDKQAFWRRAGREMGRLQCIRALGRGQQRACEGEAERASCSCYVVDSLGDHAVRDVVVWMAQPRSLRLAARHLDLAEGTPLTELCKELVAWGCAAHEIAT